MVSFVILCIVFAVILIYGIIHIIAIRNIVTSNNYIIEELEEKISSIIVNISKSSNENSQLRKDIFQVLKNLNDNIEKVNTNVLHNTNLIVSPKKEETHKPVKTKSNKVKPKTVE